MTDRPTRSLVMAGKRSMDLSLDGFNVRVVEGPDQGLGSDTVTDTLSVGSGSQNDLVVTDLSVSRQHLLFQLTDRGVTVTDRGSKNGTWVNNVRVSECFVDNHGRVRVGSTTLEITHQSRRLTIIPDETTEFHGISSPSGAMANVIALVRQLARFEIAVTITGETGTGKELVARALHAAGPRASKPFRVLDCGSLVRELLASELFGHEKGAFTGADAQRLGIFEQADGGSVFLDEVGEIDLSLQAHLLRVLETKEVVRLGSSKPIPVFFRLISATHRDLRQMASGGQFRSDLLFRLAGVTVQLPPLRERTSDIVPLAASLAAVAARRNGLPAPEITVAAGAFLTSYAWPGNVRELRNVIEAACIVADGGSVEPHHLQQLVRTESTQQPARAAPPTPQPAGAEESREAKPVKARLGEIEKEEIQQALEACHWNFRKAAERLGISRSSLYLKAKRYGFAPPSGKDG